jgi:hypothetical protein
MDICEASSLALIMALASALGEGKWDRAVFACGLQVLDSDNRGCTWTS